MSEMTNKQQTDDRHGHLRANIKTRRSGYWTIIWLAIAIAAASAVDMLFLDSMLYWGVLAAYGVLVFMAIVLFFSRRRKVTQMAYDVDDGEQAGEVTLRCTACAHLFDYDEHTLRSHAGWIQVCPNCELAGPLPATKKIPTEVQQEPASRGHAA